MRLAALLVVLITPSLCVAHGGRTDSSGGHNSASGYHYHSGGFSTPSPRTVYSPPPAPPRISPPSFKPTPKPRTSYRTKAASPRKVESRWKTRDIDFEYQCVKHDGNDKVMLYVETIVDRDTLVTIAEREKLRNAWFYLPGMRAYDKPWAVAKKSTQRYLCIIHKENIQSEETFRIHGTCTGVKRGNCLTIEFDEIHFDIRLIGVQSPNEPSDLKTRSREYLSTLCKGKTATAYCRKQDQNNEFLGFVRLADKTDVNREVIRQGYSRAESQTADSDFVELELEAKNGRKGLWKIWEPDPDPDKPKP